MKDYLKSFISVALLFILLHVIPQIRSVWKMMESLNPYMHSFLLCFWYCIQVMHHQPVVRTHCSAWLSLPPSLPPSVTHPALNALFHSQMSTSRPSWRCAFPVTTFAVMGMGGPPTPGWLYMCSTLHRLPGFFTHRLRLLRWVQALLVCLHQPHSATTCLTLLVSPLKVLSHEGGGVCKEKRHYS